MAQDEALELGTLFSNELGCATTGDDAPTAHDAAARTLEWVKLAQVLHAEHADEAAPPIEHRTSVEVS